MGVGSSRGQKDTQRGIKWERKTLTSLSNLKYKEGTVVGDTTKEKKKQGRCINL